MDDLFQGFSRILLRSNLFWNGLVSTKWQVFSEIPCRERYPGCPHKVITLPYPPSDYIVLKQKSPGGAVTHSLRNSFSWHASTVQSLKNAVLFLAVRSGSFQKCCCKQQKTLLSALISLTSQFFGQRYFWCWPEIPMSCLLALLFKDCCM